MVCGVMFVTAWTTCSLIIREKGKSTMVIGTSSIRAGELRSDPRLSLADRFRHQVVFEPFATLLARRHRLSIRDQAANGPTGKSTGQP
jgi:hypothetical protein